MTEPRRREPKQQLHRRSAAGFTIMEMLLVISIMIALSAVLVPTVSQLLGRQDMDLVKEELLGAVQLAHSQAIASGAAYTVAVTPTGSLLNGEVVVREGEPGQSCGQVATEGRIIRRVVLAPEDSSVDETPALGEVTPRVLKTDVRVVTIVPQDFGTGRVMCFKGDGSMRDPETNTPVANPDVMAPATGDVLIEFQQYRDDAPHGVLNQLIVSYNGVARARY